MADINDMYVVIGITKEPAPINVPKVFIAAYNDTQLLTEDEADELIDQLTPLYTYITYKKVNLSGIA